MLCIRCDLLLYGQCLPVSVSDRGLERESQGCLVAGSPESQLIGVFCALQFLWDLVVGGL